MSAMKPEGPCKQQRQPMNSPPPVYPFYRFGVVDLFILRSQMSQTWVGCFFWRWMRKLPGWSAHHSYLAPPFGLKIKHVLKGILLDPRAENQTSGGVCHSVRFAITARAGSKIVPIVTRNRLARSALTTMS